MDEAEYIEYRLEDQIDWYERKSGLNKKAFQRCQLTQLVMAALITLSGVITSSQFPMVSYIVPSLGAIIAIISGVLGLYKFQENWLEYRTVSESLKHEKYLFLTRSEPYHEAVPFNLFVNRVENILSEENSKWAQTIKEVAKEKEPEKE
jgi:hypothetical protein